MQLPLFGASPSSSLASRKASRSRALADEDAWLEPGAGWGRTKTLCESTELPEWYEAYTYVKRYYRLNYTACDCARSLVEVHNETCNIWSHLVGCAIFGYRAAKSIVALSTTVDLDELSLLAFTISAALMLACSTAYHAFHPVSRESFATWLVADKLGIALMVGGTYVPGVWLGFRCSPLVVRFGWLAEAGALTAIAAFIAWKRPTKRFKAVVALLVASSLAPSLHWVYTSPRPVVTLLFPKLATMLGLYALGFAVYVSCWPERWYPGIVDIFGASHQIWHLCVLAAALTWLSNVDTCLGLIRESRLTTIETTARSSSWLHAADEPVCEQATLFGHRRN